MLRPMVGADGTLCVSFGSGLAAGRTWSAGLALLAAGAGSASLWSVSPTGRVTRLDPPG